MVRGLLGVLVLGLACVAGPAQAADPSYGSTTGMSGVLYDDCLAYPYRYAVDVPADAGYRALRAWLVGPGGKTVDTDYVVPPANQWSGMSDFVLCTPADRYGTYTIRSTVEWGPDSTSVGPAVPLAGSHFSMRKPRTRTSLTVSTRRPADGQRVRYRILATDERPTGYLATAFTWVHLEKRVAGRWTRIKGGRAMTHGTGRVAVRLHYLGHHRRTWVRAVTEPTPKLTRSSSLAVRIW